jgi:hypothetical protein
MLKSAPNELQESNEGIECVVGCQVFKAVQQNDSVFGFLERARPVGQTRIRKLRVKAIEIS